MKIFGLILALYGILFCSSLYAQCSDELVSTCSPVTERYYHLKHFPVKLKKGKKNKPIPVSNYSVTLSGNRTYKISVCNAEEFAGKLVVELYDEKGLITSSYNPKTDKMYSAIQFECTKGGMYYLAYYFVDGEEGCAVGVLSMKKGN